MTMRYKVVFSGELLQGFDRDDVVINLMSMTKQQEEKVHKLLDRNKPTLLRRDLTFESAKKYRDRFQAAGLQIKVVEQKPQSQTATSAPIPEPPSSSGIAAPIPEPPSSSRIAAPVSDGYSPSSDNVYASPQADLKIDKPEPGEWLESPQKVPAGNGWHWIATATKMFLARPLTWIGMSIVMFLLIMVINFIPFLGPLISQFVAVLLVGGLMMAAHQQAQEGELAFGSLFRGFRVNRNQLLMVSVIYFLFFICLGAGIGLIVSTGLLGSVGLSSLTDPEVVTQMLMNNMLMIGIVVLIISLTTIPFMMASWFATPLVAVSDSKAWAAYKLSLRGCLKNWVPFLVYSLVFLVIGGVFFGGIFGAMALITSFLFSGSGQMLIGFLGMLLVSLAILPFGVIVGLSIYTGFRDIYYRSA